jgi:hypothetical protein
VILCFTALCKRWKKNVKQTVLRVLMPVLFISDIQRVYILDNENGQSIKIGNIYGTQDEEKQNKNTTLYVLDTPMRKQTQNRRICF